MQSNLRSDGPSELPDSCGQSAGTLPQKVVVVGCSGSGKTTLAKRVATAIGAPHIELDSLYHGPNWKVTAQDEFVAAVQKAVSESKWVVDGNYRVVRDHVWARADRIVWIDLPFRKTMSQVVSRTWIRFWRKEVLWNGNRESLWKHFLPWDESLVWWVLKTHGKRRREYAEFMNDTRYGEKIVRLRGHTQIEAWVKRIGHDR